MKLWLLHRVAGRPEYDAKNGAVVRAETDQEARAFVAAVHWNEGPDTWLDATLSTCIELLPDGEDGIVLEDNNPG